MDNRLIFLYRMVTELWGHGRETWAGNGKSGTNGVVAQQANPLCMRRSRDVERTKVVKHVPPPVEKSRYCLPCARTVNRHRWMRRES